MNAHRALDRILLGLGALLVSPQRISKVAVAIRPSTLLRFHRALVRRKYQWLFSSKTRHRPGPKGPPKELIAAILEIKRLNPQFGCPRIAQQISHAFGLEIDKDVVSRQKPMDGLRIFIGHSGWAPGQLEAEIARGRPRGDLRWSTFLRLHAQGIIACDFFVAVTATFRLLLTDLPCRSTAR